MKSILLDTNVYSALKRGDQNAVEIINSVDSVGVVSIVVLGELLAGFKAGLQTAANLNELQEFLAEPGIYLLPLDSGTADSYADVYANLRRSGKPIPTNNVWIAAAAIQHRLTLFTYDAHFWQVTGLSVGRVPSDFG